MKNVKHWSCPDCSTTRFSKDGIVMKICPICQVEMICTENYSQQTKSIMQNEKVSTPSGSELNVENGYKTADNTLLEETAEVKA